MTTGAFFWNIEKVVSKGDYLYAIVKPHPNATKNGYVLMHRIVMENHSGRLLDKNEVVHHIDKNKKNNAINNLQVMSSSNHAILHHKKPIQEWAILKCVNCKIIFERPYNRTFEYRKEGWSCCSNYCKGYFNRFVQLHGRTKEVEIAISENIQSKFIKYLDNPEATELQGAVETTRDPSEMMKI